jgi:hypothetical protein
MTSFTDEKRRSQAVVDAFVADDCVLDPEACTRTDEMLKAFQAWGSRQGPASRAAAWVAEFNFGTALRRHGVRRTTMSRSGRRLRYYLGVRPMRAEDLL